MLQKDALNTILRTQNNVDILSGKRELLLATIKRDKLSWSGHVCHHETQIESYYRDWLFRGSSAAKSL